MGGTPWHVLVWPSAVVYHPPRLSRMRALAEDLGYESAWVAEGHGGDQFAILAACAVATSRILLGTSISSVFVRSAPTIAMAAATVDHLSNQRFIWAWDRAIASRWGRSTASPTVSQSSGCATASRLFAPCCGMAWSPTKGKPSRLHALISGSRLYARRCLFCLSALFPEDAGGVWGNGPGGAPDPQHAGHGA